ncbi:MAG: hypothetical protein EOP06_11710 [Proteobacteria bacterium]|nr:MAG: hypothetical protein EOP06_11710 [Pseudomonadota bacterium]
MGTFIVGRGYIDPSAAAAGVFFKSIYHPEATTLLRDPANGILQTYDNQFCSAMPSFPIWWPDLSAQETSTLRSCNTISLREKADPFTWTTVDPDCGVRAGTRDVSCKKHATRLLVREISRESDLQ